MADNPYKKRDANETEIPAHTTFFGEIGEADQKLWTESRSQDKFDETGKNTPANYVTDENWSEEI